ncbi:molecular chaperone TorD [Halomonas sediminis]
MREQTSFSPHAGQANASATVVGSEEEHARWAAAWESESLLCRWLATLLSIELDDATLARYRKGEATPLLELLRDEHGLQVEVERLESALAKLVMLTTPHLELAADFAELFLGDARSGAPPYASLYADEKGNFHGAPTERMEARLSQAGYAVKQEVGEPADHLAVMLDYLATRCMALVAAKSSEREAQRDDIREFLGQELCSWLPRLDARCAQVKIVSDFYPALVALTAAYCQRLGASEH